MRRTVTLAVVSMLLLSVQGRARSQERSLDDTLRGVAERVAAFQAAFVSIVGTEHATQVLRDNNSRRARTRLLLSDIFFLGADDNGRAMTVRTVRRVDGRRTALAANDVERALALPPERRLEQLKALADAGARYNLGSLRRNFNDPNLGLLVLSSAYQQRFRYQDDGREVDGGRLFQRVRFIERERPTIIRDGRTGGDLPISGRAWVDERGGTWRTELRVDGADSLAILRVTYALDGKLGVMVPRRMNEDYRYRDEETRRLLFISGEVSYDDYRRFETAARIVP